jgi:hypothetical protein
MQMLGHDIMKPTGLQRRIMIVHFGVTTLCVVFASTNALNHLADHVGLRVAA